MKCAKNEVSVRDRSGIPGVFVALLSLSLAPSILAQGTSIKESELRKWIAEQNRCPEDTVHIAVEEADFTGDGQPEAMVVGSDCSTGTAGDNVHSVFSRDSEGRLFELPIADPGRDAYDVLFGQSNFALSGDGRLLVAIYTDTSGRKAPLVIRYKWNGTEFAVHSVTKSKPFETSYDCSRAKKEVTRAICYVEVLADLDVELDHAYRTALKKLLPARRKALKQEQRQWLNRRDSECDIYKWWVDCLRKLYQERIIELLERPTLAAR